ncbi:MAG TPA: P-loop NTPase [Pirellulales bacterium]|jgi:flagellar biosynthesis protein FlhG|nr:P-loop NTPase [Pirellulales bacterium]
MHDQADELRILARQWATDAKPAAQGPRKIVVSAGKGGVGTTTVAVNLAASLGRQGCRTILIDADFSGADAAMLCGIESRDTIADVLSGRRSVHEVLQPGPAGIQVVPGIWSPGSIPDCSPAAQQRLLREIDQLARHAEVVVLDAGSGLNHIVQKFWRAADEVLVVTTAEAVSIMDAYAAMKLFLAGHSAINVATVVNQSPQPDVAVGVHARIAQACQRFLGMRIHRAGSVPWDSAVAIANRSGKPLVLENSESPAARGIDQLAERILTPNGATDDGDAEDILDASMTRIADNIAA